MIKGFYVNKNKSATILNHIHSTGSAQLYLTKFRDLNAFSLLLREVIKDCDKSRVKYAVPYVVMQDNKKLQALLKEFGFRPEGGSFISQYWYRAPANLSNEPYEIVSGRMTRDDVLIVNDSIEGGVKDDLYVVRNLYKDVLTVTDSLLEAERYMKS